MRGMLVASNAGGKADQRIHGPVCPFRDGQLPPKTMLPEYELVPGKRLSSPDTTGFPSPLYLDVTM